MTLTTTFDNLVSTVLQVQRKAEVLVDKLHYINSDVHGMFGEPDRNTIEATLHELLVDLPELKESASAPMVACAVFAAEVARIPSSEVDTFRRADGSATDDTGPAAEATAASFAGAKVIAWAH
jgi:hypothetical protein